MLKQILRKIPGFAKVASVLGFKKQRSFERQFLLDTLPHRSVGAEIGVHLGQFSEKILESVSPKELHLIDPWKYEDSSVYKSAWYGGAADGGQGELDNRYEKVRNKFAKAIRSGQVKVHRGYSEETLSSFPDRYLDWVYIDGNHLYEFVEKDLEISFRKVKVGGFITGDDYMNGGWWDSGVKRAVDKFLDKHPIELIKIQNRQFILKVKASN